MKLIASLDRASDTRMRAAARPRLAMLAIIGCALIAPLLSGSALAAATGTDKPATMIASVGLLGGLAFTGPFREEDPGAPQGGGAPKADDDAKLTIGQRLSAAIASKATLQATIAERDTTIAEHNATIERLTQELATANASLTAANTKIAALEASATEVDNLLKAAEAEAKTEKSKNTTTSKKAQELTGQLGFSGGKLPGAQDVGGDADTLDDVRERMKTTTDPREAGRLAAQAKKLRETAASN